MSPLNFPPLARATLGGARYSYAIASEPLSFIFCLFFLVKNDMGITLCRLGPSGQCSNRNCLLYTEQISLPETLSVI